MLPHHGGTKRPAPQDQQSANSNNQNNKRVALSENSSAAATPSPSSSRPARSPATSTTGAAAPSTLVQPKPKAGGGLLDSIRAGKFIRTSNGASSAAESGDSALASPSAAMARASAMTPSSSAATLAAAAKARTEYQVVFPSMGSIVPPSNRHTVLNRFIVELQRIYPNDKDAGYKEALALEQKVYSAANSKMGYTNGAAHALGSLKERRQGQAPIVHADKYAMEQNIEKYLLTREQLLENGFLLSSADHVQSETTAAAPRVCERCDTLLDMDDVHTSGVEPDPSSSGKVPLLSTCQHHPGRVWQRRRGKWVCGEMAFYSCCEAAPSAVGCKTAAFHVPRAPELTVPDCMDTGKDSTCTPSSAIRCFGVDCEMVRLRLVQFCWCLLGQASCILNGGTLY
ncbi:exonuclease GOR, variant 2 [Capsaspora owczarzaki ATCC 30864]|uniref:Exonuclease GOR, variant 2 n=1 Tax=Capsaspora owczarzaki (strain ATCC 30864) TaxID=595528 RepID=A0A0D2VKS7_CAPO3|nr:exonuclease GOR, variant 2 [Capsaspora owczarzaki ATCC 30864]